MLKTIYIVVIFAMFSLTGCSSLLTGAGQGGRSLGSDVESLRAEVYQLNVRIQELESSNQKLHRDMDALNAANMENGGSVKASVADIKADLDRMKAEQDSVKKEIVADLSGKMAAVIKETSSNAGAVGRNHVVASGDTLSAICTAYGVKMEAIIKANNLKDANSIRIGQKLFIPE